MSTYTFKTNINLLQTINSNLNFTTINKLFYYYLLSLDFHYKKRIRVSFVDFVLKKI